MKISLLVIWSIVAVAGLTFAQPPRQQSPTPVTAETARTALRPDYVLGPEDRIVISAPQVEEIGEKPYQIDADGTLILPLIGRVRVAGLTVEKLEAELMTQLQKYIRNPKVVVSVVQFRSEPVFVVGSFKTTGVYALSANRTLLQLLTTVGGLQPNSSRRIRVTRRNEFGAIPLPGATADDAKGVTVAEINLASLEVSLNPKEDIALKPFDVISVDRAEMVYVNGEVHKVGGFELGDRDSLSVAQAVSLAGGLSREAAPERARVLRRVLSTSRRAEIPLNLSRIMRGLDSDFPLLPNDVLYVPRNTKRAFWTRVAYVAIPVIPTIIVLATR